MGIYPARREPPVYYAQLIEGEEPDDKGLVKIKGTGLGFACIHRKVIEHLSSLAPRLNYAALGVMPSVFRMDDDGKEARGEDYAFWADCQEHGYEIFADATLNLGHIGEKIFTTQIGDK